ILAELKQLLGSLTIEISTGTIPAGNFIRNRNELSEEKRLGIILMDANEVVNPRVPPANSGRDTAISVRLMRMTPEIYVVLDERKPQNKNTGEDLNAAKIAISRAILLDKTLRDIVGTNGHIVYDGCVTDLARNRVMEGQMGISFTFVYPWVPFEIVGQS